MSSLPPFPLRKDVREHLDAVGMEFLRTFLSRELERRPDNLAALAELAHVLTRLGRFEEGLATDRRLAELAPDNPTFQYNLACSLALVGDVEPALGALERAVELGYDDPEHLVADEDLAVLRDELRFQDLVRTLRTGA